MTPIYYIKDGNLSFGDKSVLIDIELYISPGERISLVGRNGSGKSSLMKVIFGDYELDSGQLYQDPYSKVGYLKQDVKDLPDVTIYDYVLSSFTEAEKDSNKYNADIILKNLMIDGNLRLRNCSGGQIRRSLLAESLVRQPEILLLDEPTNHLDITAIEWLEEYVKSYKGAIICISHDRAFLENITNRVWWIDRGTLRRSQRGFKYYDDWRAEIIAQEESVLKNMNRKLDAEKGWLNTGVTARRKRNQRRLHALHRLREQLQSHEQHLRSAKSKLQLELEEEERKTKFILEAKGVSFHFKNKAIVDNFNIKIKKGEKIGIIGPNGSGKTTLIKLLLKELEPLEGRVKHGTNLEITYFDQHRTDLNPEHTLQKTLCPTGGDQIFMKTKTMHVAAYLKNFMFDPRQMHDKVATLSGGEANRLLLAKALTNPGNLMILDEPTNDLDMDSLEILLEVLADYEGTLLIVSHDRDFLERLVTRTLVLTKENKIIDLYGGYEDYLKYYRKDDDAAQDKKKKQSKSGSSVKNGNKSGKNSGANADANNEGQPDKKLRAKLSYKYERLLEVLPDEIEALDIKISSIEEELMDAELYSKNPDRFHKLSKELTDSKKSLEDKLQQWEEIELMKDNLDK